MKATAEYAAAKIAWDMKDCPIPEGYDSCRIRKILEGAFEEQGYSGPVSITAYGDQTETPGYILQGLFSTGVSVAHTRSGSQVLLQIEDVNPGFEKVRRYTEHCGRNYKATPEFATAKIQVLWDMFDCPIPEGYDARQVRPSIEAAFKELGYSGPVSITAYGYLKHTPLQALSSTGVDVVHTVPG
ncbi:hypothetical protein HID58_022926 [Brassica napus]|uniref:NYN domain-containing protein n=1 Tax=Brassica napus TaxID=3708 RepID=A0ABQ8D0Z6_BRANA|nr:hypothetical protein HID58_022926 [Brassica napus]